MKEYVAARGVVVEETTAFFDEAIKCVYAHVLRGMSPPWLQHSFPQALPGNGVLSKYTRQCFLAWGADLARAMLGAMVFNAIARVTHAVGLPLSGVVARPQYTYTGGALQGMRMAIASMPQIFQGRQGRREYLCRQCACRRGGTPAADSEPMRTLLVYALTGAESGQDVAVRMGHFASGGVCTAG